MRFGVVHVFHQQISTCWTARFSTRYQLYQSLYLQVVHDFSVDSGSNHVDSQEEELKSDKSRTGFPIKTILPRRGSAS